MPSLAASLTEAVGAAFAACGLDAALGVVRASDRPELCAFQCNGAFAGAKLSGRAPLDVAEAVAVALADSDTVRNVSVVAPGFINFDPSDAALALALSGTDNDRCGVPETASGTVIVDYVGANVAKAMHVGHLRPTIIGDALKRIFAFAGHRALGDVHLGDWGLQMGQIIAYMEAAHPEWPYFTGGPYPAEAPFAYGELEEVYPVASAACKADMACLEKARAVTAALQNGHAGYTALWRQFVRLSHIAIKQNLDVLNVEPEVWKGESDAAPFIELLREELLAKGLLIHSEGAEVVPVARPGDKKALPPLIYTKSDGAATYATTDCATLYDRLRAYKDLKKVVYVVDARQNLHFQQVFRSMEPFAQGVDLAFIGFGTMNGADGRPFKTRAGGLPRFDDIVAETLERARARLAEVGLGGDEALAGQIMQATLKFADLINPPQADYIFDPERMTAFEGRTGPYVLYQAVRAGAILDKAGALPPAEIPCFSEAERPLALALAAWPEAFAQALALPSPHPIAAHAYRLAQEFARFYGACPVLAEPDPALRAARLALTARTRAQLTLALSLLGIAVPERM